MFSTKKDVDKHVKTALSKLQSENEKKERGYTIAKMYFKVGDFGSAQHWASSYLEVRESHPGAHKLLGQCYEQLKKPEKALQAYQRSLQLDPKQPGLITEVCKLLLNDDSLSANPAKGKYWCELAEKERIQNETVLNLRFKMAGKTDNKMVEEMILQEIQARPMEPTLRIRLIKYLIEEKRLTEAFRHCFEIEMKFIDSFATSAEWYNTVSLVLTKLAEADKTQRNHWNYWLLLVIVLERQVYLALAADSLLLNVNKSNLKEATNLLCEFDQTLSKTADVAFTVCPERELAAQFLYHYRGQLLLHAASLLFKTEKVLNRSQWRETTKKGLPLLLLAYHCGIADVSEPWLRKSSELNKRLMEQWHRQGAFRCSQAGRTLLSCVAEGKESPIITQIRQVTNSRSWNTLDDVIAQIRQFCIDSNWRKAIYRSLFVGSDQAAKLATSYLVQCDELAEPLYEFPLAADLESYEEIAVCLAPASLEHQVYLWLGTPNLIHLDAKSFGNLNFSTATLQNCNTDTLNQLDVDSFLFCTITQTKRAIEAERAYFETYNDRPYDKPSVLPLVNMREVLGTEDQSEWWTAVYKVCRHQSSSENLAQLKAIIQNGIETVRAEGPPKADLVVLLKLAAMMAQRAQSTMKADEKRHLENRAEWLYRACLRRIKKNAPLNEHQFLFKFSSQCYDVESVVTELAEDGVQFLAARYFKNAQFNDCIDEFEGLSLPFATYFRAEAYKKLDESGKTPRKSKIFHLEKTRACLTETLALLDDPVHKNHPLNSIVQSEIKRLQYIGDHNTSNGGLGNTSTDETLETSFLARRKELSFSNKTIELENLIRKMMDTLNLVKEDVLTIRGDVNDIQDRLIKIEETVSKRQSDEAELNDLYILDELQNQAHIPNPFEQRATPQQQSEILAQAARFSMQGAYGTPMYSNTAYPMYMQPYGHALPPHLAADPRNSLLMTAAAQQQGAYYTPPAAPNVLPQQQQPLPPIAPPPVTTKSHLETALQTPSVLSTWNSTYNNTPAERSPPVNVVITSSDPLPAYNSVPAVQPTLSVTIPIQHIKNADAMKAVQQPPIAPPPHLPPVLENVTPTKAQSDEEADEYDPCPDFQPVIPLPAEVAVTTGEENEEVLFCARAKLFRHVEKEWKERGIGDIKILRNKTTGACRILMRREAIHKICANHQILSEMKLVHAKAGDDKQLIWGAQDFADGESKTEKFLVRFKEAETGKRFAVAFEEAKTVAKVAPTVPVSTISSPFFKPPAATTAGTLPKPIFGGFTGSLTVAETKSIFSTTTTTSTTEAKTTAEPAKVSPFASFTFGSLPTAAITANEPTKPFSSIFSSLPKATTVTPVTSNTSTPNKPTAPVVANKSTDEDDEYVPTAHFQPVIPLPELVETVTGEENETIAFEHRAKLYRFDRETKEWKERGVGNMKILVNKADPSKVRLLMRRDQVLKLCCNQFLQADTKFERIERPPSLRWHGPDYSENETQLEYLALRFKTSDILDNFYEALKKAQAGIDTAPAAGKEAPKKEEKPAATDKAGWGDKFKPKTGSWTCEACYITNEADKQYCVACDSPKDSTVPKKAPANPLATTGGSKFTFGVQPSGGGFTFGVPAATTTAAAPTTTASTTFSFGNATGFTFGAPKPVETVASTTSSAITFGAKPPATTTAADATPKSTFSFGQAGGSGFTFGAAAAAKSGDEAGKPAAGGFNFSNAPTFASLAADSADKSGFNFKLEKESFEFVFKPRSPGKSKSPCKSPGAVSGDDQTDDEYHEEENNAYFTPVIQLEKVDVKTGEEDEETLYSHRAKLFRFDVEAKEWKERGLGDIKILRHTINGKLRVVMRREQVHKVCLNHVLTQDVEYKAKDEKHWLFAVADFSEGEVETHSFLLRFKNAQIAQEFKTAIDAALSAAPRVVENGHATEEEQKSASDDAAAKRALAKKLQLPESFFDYEKAEPCPGCRGCNSDEYVLPLTVTNPEFHEEGEPLPLDWSQVKLERQQKPKKKSVSFSLETDDTENDEADKSDENLPLFASLGLQQSAKSTNLFGGAKADTTPTSIFGGKGLDTAAAGDAKSIFSSALNTIPQTKNLFGGQGAITPATGAATTPEGGNLFSGGFSFGGKSIFGGSPATPATAAGATPTNTTTQTASIFGQSSIFGGAKPNDGKPLFGGGSTIFGGAATKPTIFGGAATTTNQATPIFGSNSAVSAFSFAAAAKEIEDDKKKDDTSSPPAKEEPKTPSTAAEPEFLKANKGMSFADLASTSEKNAFAGAGQNAEGGFFGLTIKEDIFTKMAKKRDGGGANDSGAKEESGEQNASTTATGEDNYDPHYEPIIQLPDEIVVSTGEEEEEKIYGERARLYRFDSETKEWKERGVGELKILHHPSRGTYRLLLRREQVHKCVLNHVIPHDFQINPMNTSGKAYCWGAVNYAEEPAELEKLAARFKNDDLAKQFSTMVRECVEKLKARADIAPEQD